MKFWEPDNAFIGSEKHKENRTQKNNAYQASFNSNLVSGNNFQVLQLVYGVSKRNYAQKQVKKKNDPFGSYTVIEEKFSEFFHSICF